MIFFDLDDTLLDTTTASRKAAVEFYKTINAAMSFDDFLAAWHVAQERNYRRYHAKEIGFQDQRRARLREVIDPTLTDAAADELFAHYLDRLEAHWSLFEDVLPCFARLAGHRLGLISNGDGALQRRKLEKMAIANKFECIIISGECGYTKPEKAIFLHACTRAGIAPQDATYVGDHYDLDAEGARKAGLHGIWLNRTAGEAHSNTLPVIASLAELVADKDPVARIAGF
jgi:putative hydrolase of the HAD superfamily